MTDPPAPRSMVVVSQRLVEREPAYSAHYEFEDLVQEWEQAELLCFIWTAGPRLSARRRKGQMLRTLGRHATELGSNLETKLDRRRPHPSDRHFDLALITLTSPLELYAIEEYRWLRDAADRVVLYLPEVWPTVADERVLRLEPWDLIDDIFVGLSPGAEVLASALGRPVTFVPMGIDSLVFGPDDDDRPIGVMNPGRRAPMQHAALQSACNELGLWYSFDTLGGARMIDGREHRRSQLGNLARARVLVANNAKFNDLVATGGAKVAPYRVVEGVAAGCRLIGSGFDDRYLAELGIEGVEIGRLSLEAHHEDAVAVLGEDIDRSERARLRRLARLRLDWAWRWDLMLSSLGLPHSVGLGQRFEQLERSP